jgi:transcriptional regulator with GAF, ATPase, and Fis domain
MKSVVSEDADLGRLLQRVADESLELVAGADGVMIGLADQQGVSYLWGAGAAAGNLGTRVDLDASLSGLAIRTRQVVCSNDTTTDSRADSDAGLRISVRSAICVPLCRARAKLGVLTVTATRANAFDEESVAAATRLGEFASAAVGDSQDRAASRSD